MCQAVWSELYVATGCQLSMCAHVQVLFKRLQGVRPRESVPLKPGAMLFAVYCDNWCVGQHTAASFPGAD
jgi:hypothetical protein